MVDAAILAAINALVGALANEVPKLASSQSSKLLSMFSGLGSGMKNISNELEVMQAFLNDINMLDHSNGTFKAWLKQVQNMAYNIHDTVDEFVYLVGPEKYGGVRFYFKKLFKEPKSLNGLKRIASEIQIEEKTLRNLAEMKVRWLSEINAGLGKNPHNSSECSKHGTVSAHFFDEDEVVGIEENRERLTSWLYSEGSNLTVISVWGMGGVGKTTLVTDVFNREKINFDGSAWFSISQTHTANHNLEYWISEICDSAQIVSSETTTMDLRELKETLKESLKENRYLIVFDDVEDPMAFRDISDVLIDSHKGNRIIIISRSTEVAFIAPENRRFKLMPLVPSESWELFCKKAFQFETNHACPFDLEKWARGIVSKCGGLPIALVSMGGMLSFREKNEVEWKRVHDQLNWELEHNPSFERMRNILNLSFNDLHRNLKNCFLFCRMFSKDHLLARKKIIRLWIAEGFVEERGLSTLEEVAEGYLVELVRRSMLQLVEKNDFGRIKRCRMHDTVRELAMSVCMKENFGFVYGDNKNVRVDTTARRLSVIKSSNEIKSDEKLPQLRTFLSFDSSVLTCPLLSSTLLHSMYLSVLDLEGLPIESLPETIGDLFNLRYLGLRRTKVKSLPKSIQRLRNLQTLDLCLTYIEKLPNGIAKLTKLRHLFVEVELDNNYLSFQKSMGIDVPNGVFDFRELQTLQALEANAEVVKRLGNLNQLRSFRIHNVKESYCEDLWTAMSKMSFLVYLDIQASNENEFLRLEHSYPPPPRLQKLCLGGRLKENIFESPLFQISGKNFQSLYLHWSRLQNDPLPSLSYLSSLACLHLIRAYDGKQLVFRAGWLPNLKELGIMQLPALIQLEMEKGTMMRLERIYLIEMKQLEEIPKGVEQIKSLKYLYCRALSPNFWGSKKGLCRLEHFRLYIM